ncbi:glutamate decarboxylase isozyme [Shigella dysenteriae 1617]|nr:glutamate decarboxylase isozyme [Shigella dysenteriae 1617]
MAVTAAKSVMAFRVLTMAVDLCRLTTRTMNVNAGHERTSKARIIHQIQLIRGITVCSMLLVSVCIMLLVMAVHGMQVYYNK